jgi:hypothetical protein
MGFSCMQKIRMNSLLIRHFLGSQNFKTLEEHLSQKDDKKGLYRIHRIYETFEDRKNIVQLDLRKRILYNPRVFLHKKLEDCYAIFSPYKIKIKKGKLQKEKISALHQKIEHLGEVYFNENLHLRAQIALIKLMKEKKKNPSNLSKIIELEKIIELDNYNKDEIEKIITKINSSFISESKDSKDVIIYAYVISENQDGKEYVITNRIEIENSGYYMKDKKTNELSFDVEIKNTTFLGVEEITDGFKKAVQNDPSLNSFNNALCFFIRKQFFDEIYEMEQLIIDKKIEDQICNRSSIEERSIWGIYETFFTSNDYANSYSLAIDKIINDICFVGPLNEADFSQSNILPDWFIEFFNEFLKENKRHLIKKKFSNYLHNSDTIDSKFLFELKTELNSYLDHITQKKFDFLTNIFSKYDLSYLETSFQKRAAILLVQDKIGNFLNFDKSLDFGELYDDIKLEKLTKYKQFQDLPKLTDHLSPF